jgi:hypothetical protein
MEAVTFDKDFFSWLGHATTRETTRYCILFVLMSYCLFCRSRTNVIWLNASLLILSSLSDNVTTYSVWVHGSYFGGSPYKRPTGSSASQPIIIRYPHAQRALIMAKCHPNFVGRAGKLYLTYP